jgi:hypothetical protein
MQSFSSRSELKEIALLLMGYSRMGPSELKFEIRGWLLNVPAYAANTAITTHEKPAD